MEESKESIAQPPAEGSVSGTGCGTGSGTAVQAPRRERRAWERYPLGETEGKIIYQNIAFPCRVLDISMGGCRVRTGQRFAAGALASVEVVLALHGVTQRIAGTTRWEGPDNQMGVEFMHGSALARNQLAALLTGLIDAAAAEAVREAAQVGSASAGLAGGPAGIPAAGPPSGPGAGPPSGPAAGPASRPADRLADGLADRLADRLAAGEPAGMGPAATRPAAVESERKQPDAVIRLLRDASEMAGEVVDLSLEGCTLRMVRPFTLGIYVRVEASLHLCGLVVQLAGVSQEVLDKFTVRFRFVDVSRRRREELEQVIAELRAAKAKQAGQP